MTAYDSEAQDAAAPAKTLPGSRDGAGPMPDDELSAILGDLLSQAQTYVDGTLAPARLLAHDYLTSKPFGNEEVGRSQVIMPEVAKAVQGIMPEFMRTFTGPKHYVEFEPTRAESTAATEQMTDLVRYAAEQDNPGFRNIYDSAMDGLVKRTGVVKWGWEDFSEKHYSLRNLTESQVQSLVGEDGVTVAAIEGEERGVTEQPSDEEIAAWEQQAQAAQQAQQPPPPPPTEREVPAFRAEVTYRIPTGRARWWAVPPEEFLFLPQSRDIQSAPYVAQRMMKTTGELLDMGITKADIEAHGGTSGWATRLNLEAAQREPEGTTSTEAASTGEAGDEHDYFEHYVRIDYNGDGRQELRLICAIGAQGSHVVKNKMIAERPFAAWSPYPEPHALVGRSVADRTQDLQRINSALVRGGLDSLAASIFPRTAYQEGMVSGADVNNTEIGASIRCKSRPADALHSYTHNFAGKEVMEFLAFFKQEGENRIGVRNGAAGLEVDALQSTGANAAEATVDASRSQVELLARVYAEQIMKPLFRGLAKLMIENQPQPRSVRLRGQWVTVDPRLWDADMDMRVNVALGHFEERKMGILLGVKSDQDAILQMFGPSAPLTSLQHAYNVRIDILKLQGIQDVDRYYRSPEGWQPPPPPPNPEQEIAKAEMEIAKLKVMSELSQKQDELDLKRQEIGQKYALEQMRLNQEPQLAHMEAALRASADKAGIEAQRQGDIEELHVKTQLKMREMEQDLAMFREKLAAEIAQAREEARIKAAASIAVANAKPAPTGGAS